MIRNLITLLLIGVLALTGYVYAVTRNLPEIETTLQDGINPTKWTQVLAKDGTPIMSFGKFHHVNVSLKEVSPTFLDALIATEDRRFYDHYGVDPISLVRALVKDITSKKIKEGGSTITQQLARNVFLSNERSLSRKIRECFLAIKLEQKLTKEEILRLYINNTYFGEGAYGVKAASQVYFGKPPSALTVAEGALLAGLPQAPSGYSPFQNIEAATERRNEVLQNLVEVDKITQEEADRYRAMPVRLSLKGSKLAESDKAPFFNRYVLAQVMQKFSLDEQSFWQSGLKIHTTLDLKAQRLAEAAVVRQSQHYGRYKNKEEAALISIETNTGNILAYVGGKNYSTSQFDRVVQAVRSPGSLFKVFTYTTAIDHGYEPSRVYKDEPFSVGEWHPENYDKRHYGFMTMARALIISNNIVAVKVIQDVGADSVVNMAEQMGIHTPLSPYLGLTLGGSGVKLMEITSAFGVLANQGVRVTPHGISKIIDDSGREIYREHASKTNVLNRSTVDTMVRMMQGVIEIGTGRAAAIGRPVAGKTGTSDNYHDAWFVGFTPDVVTGVWVGNDDNSPMRGMTGGGLPAQLWKAFMTPYMANRPVLDFDLAYSKTLKIEDFTTYQIKNLAPQEKSQDDVEELEEEAEMFNDEPLEPIEDLPERERRRERSFSEPRSNGSAQQRFEPVDTDRPSSSSQPARLPVNPLERDSSGEEDIKRRQQPIQGYGQ